MSAENAWRIAREAAAECANTVMRANGILCDPGWHVSRMDMPPAFRAEVEADMQGVVEALRYIDRDATTLSEAQQVAAALLSRLEAKGEEKP